MGGVNWIRLARDRGRGQALDSAVTNLGWGGPKTAGNFITPAEELLASHEEFSYFKLVISLRDINP